MHAIVPAATATVPAATATDALPAPSLLGILQNEGVIYKYGSRREGRKGDVSKAIARPHVIDSLSLSLSHVRCRKCHSKTTSHRECLRTCDAVYIYVYIYIPKDSYRH